MIFLIIIENQNNRILKKEQSVEGVEYFKYSKNIEIICDLTEENKASIEIIISENSINDLTESVEKIVNLFKKYYKKL